VKKEENVRKGKGVTRLLLAGKLSKSLPCRKGVVICFKAYKSKGPEVKRNKTVTMCSIYKG